MIPRPVRILVICGLAFAAAAMAAAPTKDDLTTKTDRYGDALPAGAVARYGSVRFRGEVARAPDNKSLMTLRRNRAVFIDADSGAERKALPGPDPAEFEAWQAVVSPDGRSIAYGGSSRIEIWSVSAGKPVGRFTGGDDDSISVSHHGTRPIAFSPDGNSLLIQIVDRTHRIGCWDVNAGEMRWQTDSAAAAEQASHGFGFSNHGQNVVVMRQKDKNCQLVLLRTDNGVLEHSFELGQSGGHGDPKCALAPNGEEFAFLEQNDKLRRLELPTGRIKPALNDSSPGADVNAIAYSVDGRKIALMDFFSLRICDTTTGKELGRSDRGNQVGYLDCHMEFSGDGRTLWVLRRDDRAWLKFDGTNGRAKRLTDFGHHRPITCLAMSADGKLLATGCDDEVSRIWNAATCQQTSRAYSPRISDLFSADENSGIKSLAFHPDGKNLIGAAMDSRIIIWNPETGRSRRSIRVPGDGTLSHLTVSRDGSLIAVAQSLEDGDEHATVIRVNNFADGKEVRKVTGMAGEDAKLSFSPDNRLLAIASASGDGSANIVVIDLTTGRIQRTIAGDAHGAHFTNFGHTVVYVAPEGVTVWELASGVARLKIDPPKNESIDLIAVSPDGKYLAGANQGAGTRRIYRWDLRTGESLPALYGHDHFITSLQYAPDGRLISGSQDTTALIWDIISKPDAVIIAPKTESELDSVWTELSRHAPEAHKAIERLVAAGDHAVRMIEKRLPPQAKVEARIIEKLAERLDAGRFADRQQAIAELELLDMQAESTLQRIADLSQSAEARRTAKRLLERLSAPVSSADLLRGLRVIEILQRIGTPAAQQMIIRLAQGDPAGRLTRAAKSALSDQSPGRREE